MLLRFRRLRTKILFSKNLFGVISCSDESEKKVFTSRAAVVCYDKTSVGCHDSFCHFPGTTLRLLSYINSTSKSVESSSGGSFASRLTGLRNLLRQSSLQHKYEITVKTRKKRFNFLLVYATRSGAVASIDLSEKPFFVGRKDTKTFATKGSSGLLWVGGKLFALDYHSAAHCSRRWRTILRTELKLKAIGQWALQKVTQMD